MLSLAFCNLREGSIPPCLCCLYLYLCFLPLSPALCLWRRRAWLSSKSSLSVAFSLKHGAHNRHKDVFLRRPDAFCFPPPSLPALLHHLSTMGRLPVGQLTAMDITAGRGGQTAGLPSSVATCQVLTLYKCHATLYKPPSSSLSAFCLASIVSVDYHHHNHLAMPMPLTCYGIPLARHQGRWQHARSILYGVK